MQQTGMGAAEIELLSGPGHGRHLLCVYISPGSINSGLNLVSQVLFHLQARLEVEEGILRWAQQMPRTPVESSLSY